MKNKTRCPECRKKMREPKVWTDTPELLCRVCREERQRVDARLSCFNGRKRLDRRLQKTRRGARKIVAPLLVWGV